MVTVVVDILAKQQRGHLLWDTLMLDISFDLSHAKFSVFSLLRKRRWRLDW